MTRPGPRRPTPRALVAALAFVLAWSIVAPVVKAWHAHEDGRCCRNGVCCCRPTDDPPGPCLRSVCRCAGHDGEPAGAPDVRPLQPPQAFRLLVALLVGPVTPLVVASPDPGFPASPDPPPRRAPLVNC